MRAAIQPLRFQNGGTILPRLTAMSRNASPAVVHITSAKTDAATLNLPPVSITGSSITALNKPDCSKAPDTEPEKMPPREKFHAM